MEIRNEPVLRKYRRPKSASKHPETVNTVVTDFCLQEPFDIIPINKAPFKDSLGNTLMMITSIAPTDPINDLQSFSFTSIVKKSNALHISVCSEEKIDLSIGDTENKSPKTYNYSVVDNKQIDEQPMLKFNAHKNTNIYKDNKHYFKKAKSIRHLVNFKNVNVKYKIAKYNMTLRVKQYYGNGTTNTPNYCKLHKLYCNDISKAVTRSAIANLLDDQLTFSYLYEHDNWSSDSSQSLSNKFPINCTSQSTLVPQSYSSSMSGDFYDVSTINSVVEIPHIGLHKININENDIGALNSNELKVGNINYAISIPIKLSNIKKHLTDDTQSAIKAPSNNQIYEQNLIRQVATDLKNKSIIRASSYHNIVINHREKKNLSIIYQTPYILSSVSDTMMSSNVVIDNHHYKNQRSDEQKDISNNKHRKNKFKTMINLDTMSTNSSNSLYKYDEKPIKHPTAQSIEEISTHNTPSDLNEVWDQLAYKLDSALNKFQKSLIMEIMELKKLLFVGCKKHHDKQTEVISTEMSLENDEEKLLGNNIFPTTNHPQTKADLCILDYSTENKIVKPRVNLNMDEHALLPNTSMSLSQLKPRQVLNNTIEVLKLPTFNDVEVGKGDALTTALNQLIQVNSGPQRVKQIISEPLSFVRDNRVAVISYRAIQKTKTRITKGLVSKSENILPKLTTKQPKKTNILLAFAIPFVSLARKQIINNKNNLEKNKSKFMKSLEIYPMTAIQSIPSNTSIVSSVKMDNNQYETNKMPVKAYSYLNVNKKANEQRKTIFNASKGIKRRNDNDYYVLKVKRIRYIAFIFKNIQLKYATTKDKSINPNNGSRPAKLNATTSSPFQKPNFSGVFNGAAKSRILDKALTEVNLLNYQINFINDFNLYGNNNLSQNSLQSLYNIAIKNYVRHNTIVPLSFCTLITDKYQTASITNSVLCLTLSKIPSNHKRANKMFTTIISVSEQAMAIPVDEQYVNYENLSSSRTLSITYAEPGMQTPTSSSNNENNLSNNIVNGYEKISSSVLYNSNNLNNKRTSTSKTSDKYTLSEVVINLDVSRNIDNKDESKEDNINEAVKISSEEVISSDTLTNSNKMWYQLTLALDSAVKGVQQTFVTAIREFRKLLAIYVQPKNKLNSFNTESTNSKMCEEGVLQAGIKSTTTILLNSQRNSTENTVLDLLPLKLNLNETRMLPNSSMQFRELKARPIVREYIEITKSLSLENVEIGKGDTENTGVVLIATQEPNRYERVKRMICIVLLFIRENVIAATVSIPCSIIAYFCLIEILTFAKSIDNGVKFWNIKHEVH